MRYLIALIFPPLAVLLCGKVFQAMFNFVLFVLGVFTLAIGIGVAFLLTCVIHAILAVSASRADYQHKQLLKAMKR